MKIRRILSVFLLTVLMVSLMLTPQAYAMPALEIKAKAAVLVDADEGRIIFGQNEQEREYPASITKVMTALLTLEAVDAGKLSLDQPITASAVVNDQDPEGSSAGIEEGEVLTVEQLLYCLLLVSANEAADILAETVSGSREAFVELMNQRAQELGMNDTTFVNCTGLDDGTDAVNHRTSAYDIALMSRQLLKYHPLIKNYTTIWMDTVRDGTFGLSNTNKLIRFYSGATGLKTGFTSGAGYCLSASAMRDGMELIAVVMGAETSQSRNAACKSLLDYGFANFAVVSPDLSDCDNQIPVRLGKDAGVSAVPEADMALLIDKAQKSGVTSEVTLEPTVTAPVSRGQRLGTLTVKSGDLVLKEVPLVAAQEVERLSYGEIYRMVLMRAAMAKSNAE